MHPLLPTQAGLKEGSKTHSLSFYSWKTMQELNINPVPAAHKAGGSGRRAVLCCCECCSSHTDTRLPTPLHTQTTSPRHSSPSPPPRPGLAGSPAVML